MKVSKTQFLNISDKAISVGEKSNLEANEINIKTADIGTASKDGSTLFLSNSNFNEIKKAGLMAYIKKDEYGPAKIVAKNLEFKSTRYNALAQKENKIFIDGFEIPGTDINVKELYSSKDNL